MSWQDVVLAAGGFVIAAGIIPTIRGPVKPALVTTAILVGVLATALVAFVSLGLWLTAAGIAIQWVLWGIVLVQTLQAQRRSLGPVTEPVVTTPALGFEEFRSSDSPRDQV